MCGIIAVLRRLTDRAVPSSAEIESLLQSARKACEGDGSATALLGTAAEQLEAADHLLRGTQGITCLLRDHRLPGAVQDQLLPISAYVERVEQDLEETGLSLSDAEVEDLNAALIRVRDAVWALRMDRLPAAEAIRDLGCGKPPAHAEGIAGLASIDTALSALDRLEVRGRDSAGLAITVTGIDRTAAGIEEWIRKRSFDPLFTNGAFRDLGDRFNFVYKYAAEIGELGDNVRALRNAMRKDQLLQAALQQPNVEVSVVGHTRWASVGIISEPNAHPLNSEELDHTDGPYVVAALNGDVDNHAGLKKDHALSIPEAITTDAKVIAPLVSRKLAAGSELIDAFRETVTGFEGSVAIAAQAAAQPHQLALALRGSGQALYVGITEDAYVVASEPYGVIEETATYLRMDGETPGNPANPQASRGQILVLDGHRAGTLEGIRRVAYDGTELPVRQAELQRAAITTRDIDRGELPHYLLKEITEAPQSMRKTLRGKVRQADDGQLHVHLGEATIPTAVREALRAGTIRRIQVIGQGTAAVAGQGVARAMTETLGEAGIDVTARPATELSGFHMREDMSDTLIVAISQSGTTTDTNRTVDLVRSRGAQVIAIVNRRGSDLTDKADGVLYTSDGRDVEMSVASTKAFYAQIAAGWLLALALADAAGAADARKTHELLTALRGLPAVMQQVLDRAPAVREAAFRHAPQRRYWALVGNGPNRVAANEVRIKLSELCYKSIAADATEDKKHIDLSAEPMILVCAAGLTGSTADDVAKEVAIYRAHKAAPIVVCTDGEARFNGALEVISVPPTHPSLAFVLSTMAGHLFGYYAALSIDASAQPLRLARSSVETAIATMDDGDAILDSLRDSLPEPIADYHDRLAKRQYDGSLEASTAVRLTALLTAVTGRSSVEGFRMEVDSVGTPGQVIDELTEILTRAIDELTRPVDAIKHQAKTVTVGISRSDEALLTEPVIQALLEAGAERDCINTKDLRAMADLSPAVAEVLGATRYAIEGTGDDRAVRIVHRTGISKELASRTDRDPRLRGTKHQVAEEQQMMVAQGQADGRTVILVPEVRGETTHHLTLIHVRTVERLKVDALRGVLGSYRNRWHKLKDAVLETESDFREELLSDLPVLELLTAPIHGLAARLR